MGFGTCEYMGSIMPLKNRHSIIHYEQYDIASDITESFDVLTSNAKKLDCEE